MTPTTFRVRYAEALSRACRRQFASPTIRAADRRAIQHYESSPEYRGYIAEEHMARAACAPPKP